MKKILIVGGSGFIGYNLLKNLSSLKKHKIYSTIHKNSRFIKISNVKYFKGDLYTLDKIELEMYDAEFDNDSLIVSIKKKHECNWKR